GRPGGTGRRAGPGGSSAGRETSSAGTMTQYPTGRHPGPPREIWTARGRRFKVPGEDGMSSPATRRQFLGTAGAPLALSGVPPPAAQPRQRPRVAAVFTEFTYRSHAHVILENFLEPYLFNGERTDPGVEGVSFYAHQPPRGPMTQDVAREYKIPIVHPLPRSPLPSPH